MKSIFLLALLSLGAQASVTLSFNDPFVGGVSSNLADASGTVSNDLYWGIIIDTAGGGFFSTYDSLTFTPGGHQSLSSEGITTGNVIVFSESLTQTTIFFSEGDFLTTGGDGGITSIDSLLYENGVAEGLAFRLVWFDSSGLSAGYIDDASFVLPADGDFATYDSVFVGPDEIRAATGITIVPEPSSAALLSAVGVMALLRRRRH